MSEPTVTSTDKSRALQSGDEHAAAGRWVSALSAWSQVLVREPALELEVEQRVSWFLTHSGRAATSRNADVWPLAMVSLGTALFATAFVLIPDAPGSTESDLWAGAAWVMIAISIVTALFAARGSGEPSLTEKLKRAQRVATRLEQQDQGYETAA